MVVNIRRSCFSSQQSYLGSFDNLKYIVVRVKPKE